MNINPVISLPVAADLSAYSHVGVKLTSTGIALAGPGDRTIGTMIRGNAVAANTGDTVIGRMAAVQLAQGTGLHFITLAATTAVAMADELEQWPGGRYAKRGAVLTGTAENTGDTVTFAAHGFSTGDKIAFTAQSAGTDVTLGLTYFVITATANTFQISLTSGGAAVAWTGDRTAVSFRPAENGPVVGLAVDSAPASSEGGVINAILFAARPSDSCMILKSATTLTAADSGKTIYLSLAGGFTVTLPAVSPGLEFDFIISVSPTTAYIIVTASSTNTMIGSINECETDTTEDGPSDDDADAFSFVASTALKGDRVNFKSDGVSWFYIGQTVADGAVTTATT